MNSRQLICSFDQGSNDADTFENPRSSVNIGSRFPKTQTQQIGAQPKETRCQECYCNIYFCENGEDPCGNDRDGDGWADCEDDCIDEPGNADSGCPIHPCDIDSDDDGVPDCDDKCVDAPGNGDDGCAPCPEQSFGGTNPEGKVIAVFYKGGLFGEGEDIDPSEAGGTGRRFQDLESLVNSSTSKDFEGKVIAPGLTTTSGVENGKDFIAKNYEPGDQIIIYGYSWGGDLAVDLATKLGEENIPINLLVTVDAADGVFQNMTVNMEIPDNVNVNLNIYQTDPSGSISGNPGETSNSPNSRGEPNIAINSSDVINHNITNVGVINHDNIQDHPKTTDLFKEQISKHIEGCPD